MLSRSSVIIAAAATALLFSCATAPAAKAPAAPVAEQPAPAPVSPQPVPEKTAEPAPVPPAPSAPAVKEPRVVVVRIPLETKSSVLFADGTLDGYIVSERGDDGALIAQTRFTASGALVERTEYSYKDGRLESKTTKDGEGKALSRRTYAYSPGGSLAAEVLEDAVGKRLSGFEYSYDADGKRVSWVVKDAKNTKIAETLYSYKDGRLRTAELRDGMGRKTGSSAYEYDGDHLTKQVFYDASGKVLRVETNTWENGNVILEERKSAGGVVQQRTAYEHGADGQIVKKTFEDVVGKTKLITTYEYAIKEERRTVQE